MKCVMGALQWKLPRAPLPFNPALSPDNPWTEILMIQMDRFTVISFYGARWAFFAEVSIVLQTSF